MQPALRDGCFVVDIELILTLPALLTLPPCPLQNTFAPDIPIWGIGGPVFVDPMEAVQGFRVPGKQGSSGLDRGDFGKGIVVFLIARTMNRLGGLQGQPILPQNERVADRAQERIGPFDGSGELGVSGGIPEPRKTGQKTDIHRSGSWRRGRRPTHRTRRGSLIPP